MGQNRVFFPQDALDRWLAKDRISVDGETMTLKQENQRFKLTTGLRFVEEVTGAPDVHKLVGRVKDMIQLAEIKGEHCADSVIVGDNAYSVVEGFLGEPLFEEAGAFDPTPVDSLAASISGDSLAGAARAAVGDDPNSGEIGLLARFFLSSR